MDDDRRKQVEKAHFEWAKKMAEEIYPRKPSETELRSLGRVPFFAAVEWADANPPSTDKEERHYR